MKIIYYNGDTTNEDSKVELKKAIRLGLNQPDRAKYMKLYACCGCHSGRCEHFACSDCIYSLALKAAITSARQLSTMC